MIARREILDVIEDDDLSDIGFDVLPKLVGRMSAVPITDYLLDIGTMENYQRAQETWPGA
jgi:mannose-1-phosphate guanylyltransferase